MTLAPLAHGPPTATLTPRERKVIDAEIARLRQQLRDDVVDDPSGGLRKDHTNVLVAATILLAIVAVSAIVTIFLVRPDKDNTALVATIMGFLVPLMTALLAAALQQVHTMVNSRVTQLLRITAAKSRADGIQAGKDEAAAAAAEDKTS